MRLIIAEKPELARAIVAAMYPNAQKRDGYYQAENTLIVGCLGHLLSLYNPEDYDKEEGKVSGVWAWDQLPVCRIPWKRKVRADEGGSKQYSIIKKLLAQADEIIHAGDPDEEGQLLIDEILWQERNEKPVKRVLINDNNPKLIKRAFKNMKNNAEFRGLSAAAEARSVADQIYGLNMTRAYTLRAKEQGYYKTLSVGRVQTPILGLIVRRDREFEQHKKRHFYTVSGVFENKKGSFKACYKPLETDIVDEEKRLISKEQAQQIANDVVTGDSQIIDVVKINKKTSAPLPHNLLTLQMAAADKYGFTPKKVLSITQRLREQYKLITYNRSDCQYLSEEQHEDAPIVLEAVKKNIPSFSILISGADPRIKGRAYDSSKITAHHAIIPTEANLESALPKEEAQIYEMIATAFILQFYPDYEYEQHTIQVVSNNHVLYATLNEPKNEGWKAVIKQNSEEDCEIITHVPNFVVGEALTCKEAGSEEQETKPKPRYTQSSLLKDLTQVAKYVKDPRVKKLLKAKDEGKYNEHGGIGTPATRADIIEKLFDANYVREEGKSIISTDLGREFYDCLPDQAKFPDMTALWHEQQEQIRKGTLTVKAFAEAQFAYCEAEIVRVKSEGLNIKSHLIPCPVCKSGNLVSKKGQNGNFWGCTEYPLCKATYRDKKGKPDFEGAAKKEGGKCPVCKEGTLIQKHKKGDPKQKFWGCNRYPECSAIFDDNKGKPSFAPKPKPSTMYKCYCGRPLKRIESKDGKFKPFWGCSGYPKDCNKTFKDQDGKPNFDQE